MFYLEMNNKIPQELLDSLYLGAFAYYFDNCQFLHSDKVTIFCKSLIEVYDQLSAKEQERIKFKLRQAWKNELDYGSGNNLTSPFGNNKLAWYKVIEIVFPHESKRVNKMRRELNQLR